VRAIETGGTTALAPALDAAAEALLAVDAELKHVVLLTDGKSGERAFDFAGLLAVLRRGSITLTTVGVGLEIDRPLLEALARGAGGRFLWTADARTVPRLLTQEAVTATRALLVERPIVPRPLGEIGRLGIDWEAAPPLRGYVLTVPREGAEVLLDTGPDLTPEDGPILARWRLGLGKAVAFTSDATARWCGAWLEWAGYGRVLAGAIRWTVRSADAPGLETALEFVGESGRVRVEAHGPDRTPLNGLQLGGRVMGPAGAAGLAPLELAQTAPGVYEAEFDPPRPGAYFVTVDAHDGEQRRPVGNAGAVLAYPREYRDLTADRSLLAGLAALGGGDAWSVDDPPEAVFGGPREERVELQSVAGWLFTAAALLLVVEVAVRRLVVPEGVARRLEARRARRAAARPAAATATIAALREHKRQERSQVAAARSARRERDSQRLEPPAEAPPQAPAPRPRAPAPAPPRGADAEAGGDAMSKLLEAKRRARGERP